MAAAAGNYFFVGLFHRAVLSGGTVSDLCEEFGFRLSALVEIQGLEGTVWFENGWA